MLDGWEMPINPIAEALFMLSRFYFMPCSQYANIPLFHHSLSNQSF
jgi:hypothetical protein